MTADGLATAEELRREVRKLGQGERFCAVLRGQVVYTGGLAVSRADFEDLRRRYVARFHILGEEPGEGPGE